MGGVIDEMKGSVERMKKSVVRNQRLVESMASLLKHVNARVDAMLSVALSKGLINDQAEFDVLVDANLGLRLKAADEEIAAGDVVFIRYKGKDTRTGEEFADELPIRMGLNVIVFEKDLMGKKVGSGTFTDTYEFPEQNKVIEFNVQILKVKTKIGGNNGEPGSDDAEASADAQDEFVGGDDGAVEHSSGGPVQSAGPEGAVGANGEGLPIGNP